MLKYFFLLFQLLLSLIVYSQTVDIIPILNTKYSETNLTINASGNALFFTSTRGGQLWSKTGPSMYEYDGDIYTSKILEDSISQPILVDGLNTENGEDEINISPDNKTLIYQSWKSNWKTTNGPYYKAEKTIKNWQVSETGIGKEITQFFIDNNFNATDGATFSTDFNVFIFSAGKGYYENMDLYISKRINNKWSYPLALPINTKGDERSPFIAHDGRTLYFASNGYHQSKDLDIYTINILNFDTPPVPLPTPINTTENEQSFILRRNSKSGFLIRNRDIYKVEMLQNDKPITPIEFKNKTTVYFKSDESKITSYEINKLNKWLMNIPLDNVYFDISGHTDAVGSYAYNKNLSVSRANSIYKYLRNKNIAESRISKSFYGETMPISTKYSLNRRVEIRVFLIPN